MKDIFKEDNKKQFMRLFKIFTDSITEKWPDCQDTKDYKLLFDNVVMHDENKQTELLDAWYANLTIALSRKVKYTKALERILSNHNMTPTLYHACAYNDIDALDMTSESDALRALGICSKYRENVFDENDKKIFWRYIQELNDITLKYFDSKLLYVPSRAELQANIKSKKNSISNDIPSMHKAFQTSLSSLCSVNKISDISNDIADEKLQSYITRWSQFTQDSVNSTKIPTACSQKDPSVFAKLTEHFPEIVVSNYEDSWNIIVQMNGYSAVGENIPSKMMGKIENIASKLADDIVNGRTDMTSMNLNDIGQQVLSQCDENDVSQFTNNVENLLPALQSFQKNAM